MWFIDASTGDARHGTGSLSSPVTSVTYSPEGRAVASTGTDNKVIVWDPQVATAAEVLTAPAEQVQGVAFSPDGSTLYTSSLGGVLLEWDLTGDRRFGRRFALGGGSPCCGAVTPIAPPLALSPDGTTFAARLGRSQIGLFSTRTLQRQASFTIRPRHGTVTALAWSPTQPELAVAGDSGLMEVWRVNGAPRLERSLTGQHETLGSPEASSVRLRSSGRLSQRATAASCLDHWWVVAPWHITSIVLQIWRSGEPAPESWSCRATLQPGTVATVHLRSRVTVSCWP